MKLEPPGHLNKVCRSKRIMSPHLFLLLCAGLFVQSTFGGRLAEDFYRTVDGILYRYLGTTKYYSMAEKKCRKNGGNVAIINEDFLSIEGPLSFFASVVYGTGRVVIWISMTGIFKDGGIRWFDESPDSLHEWKDSRYVKRPDEDCGVLVLVDVTVIVKSYWTWKPTRCWDTIPNLIICQYGVSNVPQVTTQMSPKSPEKGVSNVPQATTQMSSKSPEKVHRRKKAKPIVHKPQKSKPLVLVQTDEHFYITGQTPVVDKRVPMITVCARLCQGKCRYTNYNGLTGHCRGYADGELTGKKDTKWQLWEPKPVE